MDTMDKYEVMDAPVSPVEEPSDPARNDNEITGSGGGASIACADEEQDAVSPVPRGHAFAFRSRSFRLRLWDSHGLLWSASPLAACAPRPL